MTKQEKQQQHKGNRRSLRQAQGRLFDCDAQMRASPLKMTLFNALGLIAREGYGVVGKSDVAIEVADVGQNAADLG